MKLPEKVKIGGHTFNVTLVEVVNKHSPRRAEIDHLEGEIRIKTEMCHSKQEQSLLHEILHELDQQCATGLDEETLIRLAEGLYDVLKTNKLYFGLES